MERERIKVKEQAPFKKWTLDDSSDLYNLNEWGLGFFRINELGNVIVSPFEDNQISLDLMAFVEQLQERGIQLPVLIRFSDILKRRVDQLNKAFSQAITEHDYKGSYRGVYPIKVNQHRHVVEEIVSYGHQYNFGLEAGSKPELLLAIALIDNPEALVVCNGYKDAEFIETALIATKIGKRIVLVVEKLSELEVILQKSIELNVEPIIGIRAKLSARGVGPWEGSGGDKSKFGLFASEIVKAVNMLKEHNKLQCLQLLHFHLGSQITAISNIKDALMESVQIFIQLSRMGVQIKYFDVGGGLAVDYDGSKSSFASSANYTAQEYASDVVWALTEGCKKSNIPHPDIISESGRALVAHHAVLIVEVLGVSTLREPDEPVKLSDDMPDVLKKIIEVRDTFSPKGFREAYHDALQYKDEALTMFKLGYLSLEDRAKVETVFYELCQQILKIFRTLDFIPDEMEGLERFLADIYFCNFSVFQSMPDHWAVKQLFPIVPIHRLNLKPTQHATLADITCDSDGKVDQFIDLRNIKDTIELHSFDQTPYYIGVFLVGAYQEILGDMHNLFGDTNVVHVSILPDGNYEIGKILRGDTVTQVLSYVQYPLEELLHKIDKAFELGVNAKLITLRESAQFMRMYEDGLRGYTYLEGE